MNTITDRIQFLSLQYKSIRKFALLCDIDPTTMLSYIGSGKRKVSDPTGEALRKIVLTTGCNGHWLLTGKGSIYQDYDQFICSFNPANEQLYKQSDIDSINDLFIKYCFIPRSSYELTDYTPGSGLSRMKQTEGLSNEELIDMIEKLLNNANVIAESFRNKAALKKIRALLIDTFAYIQALSLSNPENPIALHYLVFIRNRLLLITNEDIDAKLEARRKGYRSKRKNRKT